MIKQRDQKDPDQLLCQRHVPFYGIAVPYAVAAARRFRKSIDNRKMESFDLNERRAEIGMG